MKIVYFDNGDIYTKIEYDDKYNLIGLYEQYYYKQQLPSDHKIDGLRIGAQFKNNLLYECIIYDEYGNINKEYMYKKYYKEYDSNNNLIVVYYYDEENNKFYNHNDINEEFQEFDNEDEEYENNDTSHSDLRAKQGVNISEEVKYIRSMIKYGHSIIIDNH